MRTINSLISTDARTLPREIVSIFDGRLKKTFFVLKVESRIYMALSLPGTETERVEMKDFLSQLADSIQLVDLSRALHIQHKGEHA